MASPCAEWAERASLRKEDGNVDADGGGLSDTLLSTDGGCDGGGSEAAVAVVAVE